MSLNLYYDCISQPSRALYIFFKVAEVPFVPNIVNLIKGEHFSEEFKQNLNKFQKVPFVHHGDFKLPESVAIVRYVSREFPIADHWYPKDSKKQAEADIYLEWQHMNVRLACASYFMHKWMMPRLRGKEPNPERVAFYKEQMIKALKNFQELFLSESTFINGEQISYADIAAACEIEQTRAAGYDARDHFPTIKKWIELVRNECNPYYDEVHKLIVDLSKQELKGRL